MPPNALSANTTAVKLQKCCKLSESHGDGSTAAKDCKQRVGCACEDGIQKQPGQGGCATLPQSAAPAVFAHCTGCLCAVGYRLRSTETDITRRERQFLFLPSRLSRQWLLETAAWRSLYTLDTWHLTLDIAHRQIRGRLVSLCTPETSYRELVCCFFCFAFTCKSENSSLIQSLIPLMKQHRAILEAIKKKRTMPYGTSSFSIKKEKELLIYRCYNVLYIRPKRQNRVAMLEITENRE